MDSKWSGSESCGLGDLGCRVTSCLPETNHTVDELKRPLVDVGNSWFLTNLLTSGKEDFERVSMPQDTSSTACELTMLIFVHICYIQCDLFDCCIFNYEIMPATLASTFLFILQGSALADLRYGGRL